MELDDMKLAWQALNRQLEGQQALDIRLRTESHLDKMKHGLRPLFWGQVLQMAFGVWVAFMAGSFWFSRMAVTHFLIWGLLAHAFGILMIVAGARNLYLIQKIDYSAPILDIQRRIAALRAWRVRVEGPLSALIGSFIWIPIVLIEMARIGVDLEIVAPQLVKYLVLSGFVSLGLVVLATWLVRRAGHRRWLENNLAGTSVRKAESMLEQIARFERE